jgi:hypothetical protein
MSASLDELSPDYLGEDRIGVSLSQDTPTPAAFAPVTLDIDYSECMPEGVVLPLELIVRGPSTSSNQHKIFSRHAPSTITFKPREGGFHLVTLREVAHNRWWGRLKFQVSGSELSVRSTL